MNKWRKSLVKLEDRLHNENNSRFFILENIEQINDININLLSVRKSLALEVYRDAKEKNISRNLERKPSGI